MKPPTGQSGPKPVPNSKRLLRENVRLAKKTALFSSRAIDLLTAMTREFQFSIKAGELQIINGNWYVTHTGLLRLARRKRCCGIHVEAVDSMCESAANRFVLKATVFPSKGSSGFVGYGDADPSNVSSLVRGAEMRVAETRAVNRALRKAYGIGICSVEEIGSFPNPAEKFPPQSANGNGMARAPRSATVSARSSASTSSIPNWSRPTRSTSAARGRSERQAGNRWGTSSSNWPSGPRRTAMR